MGSAKELRFATHDLGFACYAVSAVSIGYAGARWDLYGTGQARAKTAADGTRFPNARVGSWPAFAGWLTLRWRDRDGAWCDSLLDLDAIFPGHTLALPPDVGELYPPMPLAGGEPTIWVELNHRTLSVGLCASLQLQAAAGRGAGIRQHCLCAYSATL